MGHGRHFGLAWCVVKVLYVSSCPDGRDTTLQIQGWAGFVAVDGKTYSFLGAASGVSAEKAVQKSFQVSSLYTDATSISLNLLWTISSLQRRVHS